MATEVWPELTNIQDEDVLRRMWQETEDFGRKKEIRARMYKIREQRLKDFYTTGDAHSEVTVRKTKTHTESIGDQGSFLTMKTKEIRDSESPTRDISCTRRGETWSSSYDDDKASVKSENAGIVQVHQSVMPVSSGEVTESSAAESKRTSQKVAQSSSVQSSRVTSQSIVKSSKSESEQRSGSSHITSVNEQASNIKHRTSGNEGNFATTTGQITSENEGNLVSTVSKVTTGNVGEALSSGFQRVTSGSQRMTSESKIQHGGEQKVTSTRTIKQSSSATPVETVTTTVTRYTSSDSPQYPVEQTSVRTIQSSDQNQGVHYDSGQNRSAIIETRTSVVTEPKITRSVTESVSRSQEVQQSSQSQQIQQSQHSSSSYSTQSASSSVQKTSSAKNQNQNISEASNINEAHYSITSDNNADTVQSSKTTEVQRQGSNVLIDSSKSTKNEFQTSRAIQDQQVLSSDIKITEVDSRDHISNVKEYSRKDSKTDIAKQQVTKASDSNGSQNIIKSSDARTVRSETLKAQNENLNKRSSNTTDQKILNEIQKLDTYLSTQPTPSSSVPISPQSVIDANWPVDKEFVYTDNTPREKPMVNGERPKPIRHPSNLELPDGATEGQYVTTYQHDYSPRVSRDHDINHQYFASTLRASPDRSSPSPSKRSSSKGSLDRSTPDRKYRGSPTRKTPDHERRLSSSSYTIERISDNKRYTTDSSEKSQTLPKDSKPKRKLSSTQTKAANKTRVSTPGASPTTSPTRLQRGRKPSYSDSESDHSNATFNKPSSRKTETNETKKYGSTSRIRGSSTSVNVTDKDARLLSSPSPTRYPARENTPDYSSEGSITRELRTARNIEKSSTTLDSSPERSAFAPIKSFRTSPERKDQTLNMIDEERKHALLSESTKNVDLLTVDTDETVRSDLIGDRSPSNQYAILKTPDSSLERSSKDRITRTSTTEINKMYDKKTKSDVETRTTLTTSPERKAKKPEIKGKQGEKNKPKTPVNSPERRSPNKVDKNLVSERHSPTKIKTYSSPQKVPNYSKPKSSNITITATTVVKKTTKTDGDRITRRSSIPRAELNKPSRPSKHVDSPVKTGSTRTTTSCTTRLSNIRNASSPATQQIKTTTVNKSTDRTVDSRLKESKTTVHKKPELATQKRMSNGKVQPSTLKTSYDKIKPKITKTHGPSGQKKETTSKIPGTDAANRTDKVTKTISSTRKDKAVKSSTNKTKKEVTHTDSREIIKAKFNERAIDDKASNDSIEDEQPPEFFDELDYQDELDRVDSEKRKFNSNDFILHESNMTATSTCDKNKFNKTVTESSKVNRVTDDTNRFIAAEQTPFKPIKPSQESIISKRTDSTKHKKQDTLKTNRKTHEAKETRSSSSSSSENEDEVVIKYDDFSNVTESNKTQKKVIKREAAKETPVADKSKVHTLKVIVQHAQSSRDSSPEKSIPMSVTSDGGQTPRYADFIIEPEDVEVFDASNLGPNKPIPSTILDENRIIEESDDSSKDTEKVSVAQRVTKYIEKTNKIDIVTLDTTRQQSADTDSEVLKTKELFESIAKPTADDAQQVERRDSKKFSDVNEFIQSESLETFSSTNVTTKRKSVDTVDKSYISDKEIIQQQTSKSDKPSPKKQPSTEDILKKVERRLSEHSPDMESKKAFFEKKAKDIIITETIKAPGKEPLKSSTPFDQKIPNYMKDTETAVTRKESIQKEFAPVRQGTETDFYHSKEKRSSIDVDKMDTFIKSETYHVCKDTKSSPLQTSVTKDVTNRRRSSAEVQELDTFKKSEAYIVSENRSSSISEKRSSVDLHKNVSSSVIKKDSTETAQIKRKQSQSKSPERSPTRKTSKDKSQDRVPLKKRDTNIITDVSVNESNKSVGKFGVTLRRTSSSGVTSSPKSSQQESIILPEDLPEIEKILDLQFLEILLTRAVLYDERRRIRAQIRIVKKKMEEQNQEPVRRSQTISKTDRSTKDDFIQRKELTKIEKTTTRDRKRTPSPSKEIKIDDFKKPGLRTSPDRSIKTTIERKDSQKAFEERRISTDKNSTTVHTVKSYTSPDKSYSVKQTKTETHRVGSGTSPERRTSSTVETVTRKSTPYPAMTSEKKSSSYESRFESHSTSSRSSPERKLYRQEETSKSDYSPDRTRKTTDERKSSRSSPDRKTYEYETRRTSETVKSHSRSSPERKISKDYDIKSSFSSKDERRSSDVRRSSKSSPDRKVSSDYDSRRTSETRNYSKSSPERKVSSDVNESSRISSQIFKSSSHTTTTTSVGRKGEDSITSSYGVGPTDDQGRPLFGLRALRSTNRTPDDTGDIEVGEDVGDGLIEDIRGSDGRPLFGLKALKTSTTTTTTSSSINTSDMPSTQHLVQKHQQFLSEVKSSDDKVRSDVPRARLRDSFILDSDEAGTGVVASLPQGQGVSLKSIIQKHEDMATNGKNIRREVQSTKTVTSSHGTISSDGKVSLTKHIVHGEMRGKDGAEPTGKITSSQYSYRNSGDPAQKPQISSTTTTTHLGGSQRNSITSLGEVRIEELKDSDSRRDSLVSSARKSLEFKQKEETNKQSDQSTWQSEKKSVVRGDSIKALQHKFQQPTVSSALKRVSGEEVKTSRVEERRTSVKDDDSSSRVTKTTTVTSSTTRRDSGSNLTSKQTMREGSKSVTSFLDDTSKVTGVQDILHRMRNADLVTESSDTTEDSEARSLLNKFLGASVILQGMEAGGGGPASSALVSQVERQRILTSTQRKSDDIDDITDEKQLQILLEACSDYEQRRKIRARLRKIMADRKGGQGELIGGEDGEERREEFSETRHITSTDGGNFTKTEVHKTSSSTARLTKASSIQQSPFAKFRQLERQNSAPSGGVLFKLTDPKLVRSASTIKDRLLCWARAQTASYKNVQIDNFSTSWSNGLAFCALIHHFYPDAFDYDSLTPESRRHNFELAFRVAEEKGDIYPLLDVEDMVTMHKPDWKCVFTYVQSIYRRLHNQQSPSNSV